MIEAKEKPVLLDLLIRQASRWTGFRSDAILRHAVAEVAGQRLRGHTESQLMEAIERSETTLVHDVCQAVSVGETYFFRHHAQFELAAQELHSRFSHESRWRAWSAGCATGEEAYSLAALLRARRPKKIEVEVLGTDLVDRNVEVARSGVYGAWSVRGSEPLAPTFHAIEGGRLQVNDNLRPLVAFAEHNLLGPLPQSLGRFHVIFCRNVLVYFSRSAAIQALSFLTDALVDGGLLFLGTMDVTELPPGLRRAGPVELQVYERTTMEVKPPVAPPLPEPKPPRLANKRSYPVPKPSPPSAPPGIAMLKVCNDPAADIAEPVALHLRALALIEGGDLDVADRVLEALSQRVPDYLPAKLERALLHLRLGERRTGQALMRGVLLECQRRPADDNHRRP